MTASQLMIVVGVLLLGHEIKPAARVIIGCCVGMWGAIFALASMIF